MKANVGIYSPLMLIILLLTIGTVSYSHLENWSYVDSLYFSTTTLMTIGYGDLHPTSDFSKLFTVVYIICGVSVGIIALTSIASYLYEKKYPQTAKMLEDKVNKRIGRKRWKI